ncbi:hypothetical protein H7K45_05045 [Mycobacterium yunnanensis]|uniref:Uncharacterized protein n=1 Tax=Mycobacterium yunnanensis TaxID=368477 RepID=A0A9X3C0X6_9MYCO|nr:hypothetical protein [Mycobacterium yunnanensis]MCV7419901.1 hypothetical protein [Mycobacterium yunnanensis]
MKPSADLLAGDPKSLGQHASQRLGAQFGWRRFALQSGDHPVPDGGQLPGHRLQFPEQLD